MKKNQEEKKNSFVQEDSVDHMITIARPIPYRNTRRRRYVNNPRLNISVDSRNELMNSHLNNISTVNVTNNNFEALQERSFNIAQVQSAAIHNKIEKEDTPKKVKEGSKIDDYDTLNQLGIGKEMNNENKFETENWKEILDTSDYPEQKEDLNRKHDILITTESDYKQNESLGNKPSQNNFLSNLENI